MNFLREWTPSSWHKKGLKKIQDNNPKDMSAQAEAIKALVKPKVVPKGGKLNRLVYIARPKLGNVLVPISPRVSSSAGQSPRSRLKPRRWLQLQLRLQLRPRPPPRLQSRGFCLPL